MQVPNFPQTWCKSKRCKNWCILQVGEANEGNKGNNAKKKLNFLHLCCKQWDICATTRQNHKNITLCCMLATNHSIAWKSANLVSRTISRQISHVKYKIVDSTPSQLVELEKFHWQKFVKLKGNIITLHLANITSWSRNVHNTIRLQLFFFSVIFWS